MPKGKEVRFDIGSLGGGGGIVEGGGGRVELWDRDRRILFKRQSISSQEIRVLSNDFLARICSKVDSTRSSPSFPSDTLFELLIVELGLISSPPKSSL